MHYSYAPGNKRVWRGGNGSTDEVTYWGVTGQKLATYQLSSASGQLVGTQTGTNYYFGAKLLKNAGGYVYQDRLGSIGKYYPYGQERPSATQNGTEKFTGYFRAAETGLDYAANRYEQPGVGRFLTPDADSASGDANDPGSRNRYAYVGGDPINRTDPTGEDYSVCASFDTVCQQTVYGSDSDPGSGQTGATHQDYSVCASFDIVCQQTVYGSDYGHDSVPYNLSVWHNGVPVSCYLDGIGVDCADPSWCAYISELLKPTTFCNVLVPVIPLHPGEPPPLGFAAPTNCGQALAELVAATGNVLGRVGDIVQYGGKPDKGHVKALQQAVNRLKSALAAVTRSCASYAGAAAAIAAGEAALEAAAEYLAFAALFF